MIVRPFCDRTSFEGGMPQAKTIRHRLLLMLDEFPISWKTGYSSRIARLFCQGTASKLGFISLSVLQVMIGRGLSLSALFGNRERRRLILRFRMSNGVGNWPIQVLNIGLFVLVLGILLASICNQPEKDSTNKLQPANE